MTALPHPTPPSVPADAPASEAGTQRRSTFAHLRPAVEVRLAAEPRLRSVPDPHLAELAEVALRHDNALAGREPQVSRALSVMVPGSGLYTDRPTSPGEIIRRARYGQQVPSTGPLRTASIGYGYTIAAFKITLRTVEWVIEHPARLAVASVLVGLLLLIPFGRQVLAWLLYPAAWAYGLLTPEAE